MSDTPRLEKILRAVFYALAVRGLTLAEGPALLRARDPEGVRRLLTEGLPDPVFQITWDELNGMPRKEFAEHVESTITRLSKFLAAQSMRLVVGQRERSIDFRTAMDRGDVILVDLGARRSFSYENARVLGTLLINDLFLSALGRDERTARQRPFTLYLDEAYDFLSWDIERILDQSRKFGLQAVLAHQRIGQLRERGEGIYNAVMGGTQTKIVFGGLSDDDAAVMAREIMRGDIDLERPKRGITTPVVVDEVPFWLESESSTESFSESRASSHSIGWSEGWSAAAGLSRAYAALEGQDPEQQSITEHTTETTITGLVESYGVTEGTARGFGLTTGRSQTLRPVREERYSHFYTLEESLHLAQLKLRNLPDRKAIVKRRGRRTVRVDTAEVRPAIDAPRLVARFRELTSSRSTCLSAIADAESQIAARQASLVLPIESTTPIGGDAFWHEE